jgi:hypothetical protein
MARLDHGLHEWELAFDAMPDGTMICYDRIGVPLSIDHAVMRRSSNERRPAMRRRAYTKVLKRKNAAWRAATMRNPKRSWD